LNANAITSANDAAAQTAALTICDRLRDHVSRRASPSAGRIDNEINTAWHNVALRVP
jgi:hypothetical protein